MSANYKTVQRNVKAEQFTGSNFDAIALFVGPANFSCIAGNVKVFGNNPVGVNQFVVLDRDTSAFIEVADESWITGGTHYMPDLG